MNNSYVSPGYKNPVKYTLIKNSLSKGFKIFHAISLYVNSISHNGDSITFSLESSVVDPNEVTEKNLLSDSNTLKGLLVIYKIKKIKIGDEKYNGIFQMEYDDGDILDLEINGNKVFLLIEWKNYPPKVRKTDVSKIEIESENIQWIPNFEP